MAQRKVLIKYFPKNFNHQIIVKRGRGKDKLMMVRNMLPMSLRCNTCANYLYIGTKFNMRMQICNEETYLGIKVFRFYFKCTYCYAEITFKTDPKNHDYVVEAGGTRNYQAIKDAQQAEKYLKKLKVNEKEENSMKYLENKSYDSKRQMELMEALEDIKNLNKRQAVIDPEDLLKNMIYQEQQQQRMEEEEQAQIQKRYEQMKQQMIAQKTKTLETVNQSGQIKGDVQQLPKQMKDDNSKKVEQKKQWKTLLKGSKPQQNHGKSSLSMMKKKIVKSVKKQSKNKGNNDEQ